MSQRPYHDKVLMIIMIVLHNRMHSAFCFNLYQLKAVSKRAILKDIYVKVKEIGRE